MANKLGQMGVGLKAILPKTKSMVKDLTIGRMGGISQEDGMTINKTALVITRFRTVMSRKDCGKMVSELNG